ncbi:MAG: hypothetical protein AB7P12_06525 [Alphaproteobacteria bacterium]
MRLRTFALALATAALIGFADAPARADGISLSFGYHGGHYGHKHVFPGYRHFFRHHGRHHSHRHVRPHYRRFILQGHPYWHGVRPHHRGRNIYIYRRY